MWLMPVTPNLKYTTRGSAWMLFRLHRFLRQMLINELDELVVLVAGTLVLLITLHPRINTSFLQVLLPVIYGDGVPERDVRKHHS